MYILIDVFKHGLIIDIVFFFVFNVLHFNTYNVSFNAFCNYCPINQKTLYQCFICVPSHQCGTFNVPNKFVDFFYTQLFLNLCHRYIRYSCMDNVCTYDKRLNITFANG